jgi:DNA-binding response OmpR family regulator
MRVLIVEDDPDVAAGVRDALVGEGFTVEWASDGEKGLDRASSGGFDLVVLDVMLPKLNGFRVCRGLREAEVWTPVLMLTAKSGEFDEAEGLELGADDYLSKPFSMVVLVARVHALLRRPIRRADWPAVGGLRLDPLRRQVTSGCETATLTAREMEVLAYLLDRPAVTVTRAELLGAVWGEDFEGDPNIVDVYVSHLRRKLDPLFEEPSIETVRGKGYRLEVEAVA